MASGDRSRAFGLQNSMIFPILVKLPVKSILRFKTVSKSWGMMISHPKFQDAHWIQSQRKVYLLFQWGIYNFDENETQDRLFAYRYMPLDLGGRMHKAFVVKVNDPIKLMLPSCRGVLCLSTSNRIYLYNPSTHQVLGLPPCPDGSYILGFGFGYLDSIRSFKVVQMVQKGLDMNNGKLVCSMFTLEGLDGGRHRRFGKTLSENFPFFVNQFSSPVFAKETIFWKVSHCAYPNARRINNANFLLAFHLKSEKFQTVPHPAVRGATHLAEIGGTLSMIEVAQSEVIIWMMKEKENLNCNWEKGGLIDLSEFDRRLIREVKYVRNGEIMFSSVHNRVVCFSFKNKTFRHMALPNLETPLYSFEFYTYSEGLFSMGGR